MFKYVAYWPVWFLLMIVAPADVAVVADAASAV